jgi:hypothetical protein
MRDIWMIIDVRYWNYLDRPDYFARFVTCNRGVTDPVVLASPMIL